MEGDAAHPAVTACGQAGDQQLPFVLGLTSEQFSCSIPVGAPFLAWWPSCAAVGMDAVAASEPAAKGAAAVLGRALPVAGSACLMGVEMELCRSYYHLL